MSLILTDLAPLRVPAFRRYVVASTAAFVSMWIFMTAATWSLLESTGSAAVLGALLMAMTLPFAIVGLPAGALTDRIGPRNVIALAIALEAACVVAMAALALSGHLSVPLVLGLAVVFGTADGANIVSSQVFVARLVEPDQMGSAIGLGLLSIGLGRIVGGPLGGFLVATLGAGVALAVASAGLAVAAFVMSTMPKLAGVGGGARVTRADIAEGIGWMRRTTATRPILILAAITAVFMWPYLGLLAVVTRDLLMGDPTALGWVTAAGGIGAIAASLLAGTAARLVGAGRLLVVAVAAGALALAFLGLSRWLPATLVAALVVNAGLIVYTAMASLLLQSMTSVGLRGRVMAIHGMVGFGLMPIGMLAVGIATDALGVATILVVMGAMTLVGVAAIVVVDRRTDLLGHVLRRDVTPIEPVVTPLEPVVTPLEPLITPIEPAGPVVGVGQVTQSAELVAPDAHSEHASVDPDVGTEPQVR